MTVSPAELPEVQDIIRGEPFALRLGPSNDVASQLAWETFAGDKEDQAHITTPSSTYTLCFVPASSLMLLLLG